MENIIKTKYKIGDRLYWYKLLGGQSYSICCDVVKTMVVEVSESHQETQYRFLNNQLHQSEVFVQFD